MQSLSRNAHWLLRIAFASVFIVHGAAKALDLGGFSTMMGLNMPVSALVTFAELAAGIGILIGPFTQDLITRLAGLAIVPVMLGAIVMVHWGRWSFMPSETHPAGGMEFQVVLLLTGIYFALTGNNGSATDGSAPQQ